ncbi:MAG: hypothetical protein AAFV72_07915 [Cyanobacteria bacterium J06635_1]
MSYSQFTLQKVVRDFELTVYEGIRFFPELSPVEPSELLDAFLAQSIPVAVATGSEKARSEGIIYPILLEIKRLFHQQISFFSGEEFNVDDALGLNGVCDFLISRSPEQLFIQAPAVVIVEAKKSDLKSGLGQCVAEMIAAQKFNESQQSPGTIYGCVSSGTQWRFLKLDKQDLSIDLTDYPLPPAGQILAFLAWMTDADAFQSLQAQQPIAL